MCDCAGPKVIERVTAEHPDCFVLQSGDRELFIEASEEEDRTHTSFEWMRALRRAIELARATPTHSEPTIAVLPIPALSPRP